MAKMLDVYRQIGATADWAITDDDMVSLKEYKKDGTVKKIPLTIKGRRLVIPSALHMSNGNWEDRVAFHPFSENTARGESEVLERLRACINERVNTVFPIIVLHLLRLANSPAEHAKLTPEQGEFLPIAKDVNEKLVNRFKTILEKMPVRTPTKQFIHILLRRSARIDGRDYFRGGMVSFPFYQELLKEDGEVQFDRKKDRQTLINIFNYILPHQGELHFYSRGSDSRIAPSIDAVMKATLAVIGPLNDVIERFDGIIPADKLIIPADWAESFDNLETFLPEIRELPMLQGNEGAHPDAHATVQPAQQAPRPAAQSNLPSGIGAGYGSVQRQPQQQPEPSYSQTTTTGERKTDLAKLLGQQRQQQVIPANYPPPQQQQPYYQPQPQYRAGVHGGGYQQGYGRASVQGYGSVGGYPNSYGSTVSL